MESVTSNGSKRAATHREVMKAAGFVQVSAWIPESCAADFYVIARNLREKRDLTFGPLRSASTGKLTKVQ